MLLPVISDVSIKSSTGIRSMSPAHDLHSLKTTKKNGIREKGCIDPTTGKILEPKLLDHIKIGEKSLPKSIISLLKDTDNFITDYMSPNVKSYVRNGEEVYLMPAKSFIMNVSEQFRDKCLRELIKVKYIPEINIKGPE